MALRLDLGNKEDREFLEKRGIDTKAIWNENKEKAIVALRSIGESSPNTPEIAQESTSKYKNRRVIYEGGWFDSKFELSCWQTLQTLERQGTIKNLKRQITLKFEHNGVLIMRSRPDFYFELHYPNKVVPLYADAKSTATAKLRPFKIAQNLSLAFYGIPIVVFTSATSIPKIITEYIEENK